MSQVITRDGFVADLWPADAPTLEFDALWTGQELPVEGPIAVQFDIAAKADDLMPWFDRIDLVILPFASSSDGRGFSQARVLRQLGYTGRIRARGHVLVDQFRAALRAGIDEIEIDARQSDRNPEEQWLSVPLEPGYHAQLFAAE